MRPSADRASFSRRERIGAGAVLLIAALGLVAGWRLFWFLTDDAFIAFRYVSNAQLGHGYVWNAPPFLPVEGYTSFLWVVLLDLVWSLTGVEPPRSANTLALAFAGTTLLAVSWLVLRRPFGERLRSWRVPLLGWTLLFLLTNTTFLAWTSSGLETALFCALVTWWGVACLRVDAPQRSLLAASTCATALALTRPDGLLYCAATAGLASWLWLRRGGARLSLGQLVLSVAPMALVPLHLLWRFTTYGAWLPNSYYAKVSGAHPMSGLVYAASFALEYALWFVVGLAALALLAVVRRGRRPSPEPGLVVLAMTLLAHFGYYTLVVGGDHFEYRVYNHLLPFIALVLLWAVDRLQLRPVVAAGCVAAFVVLSLPVGWTHWALTHDLTTRRETKKLQLDIAPSWPAPVRWYAELFDRSQRWLIPRLVCTRRQTHAVFVQDRLAAHPSREQGMRISSEHNPVLASDSVGIAGWTLPHVHILDRLGLNDYVIARTPVIETKKKTMAHDRWPPRGYVETFRPNITLKNGVAVVRQRQRPLTDREIRAAEARWRARVDRVSR